MKDLGFFSVESTPYERGKVEEVLKRSIDVGVPCSFLNMENQLISGYDDTHFIVQQPWPKVELPFTPRTLTFQTWKELGNEIHINFFTFSKTEKADDETIIKESLGYALDMTRNPVRYRPKHYHVGIKAYDAWINAVKDGYGASHGNWWNGIVWGECREMASKYFSEIASKYQGHVSKTAVELGNQYKKISSFLKKASDKKLADYEKIKTLQEAQEAEERCMNEIEELLNAFTR